MSSRSPAGRPSRAHADDSLPAQERPARHRETNGVVRLALVGCGYWGTKLANCLSSTEDCRVTWCCDIDPAAMRAVGRLAPSASCARSLSRALAAGGFDAVILATPASTHGPLAREVLERGLDLFVEKPVALSPEDVHELGHLAHRHRAVLMVGHQYLFNPVFRRLRQVVRSGAIGPIRMIESSRKHRGMVKADVNVVWDLASHDIAMLDSLAGGPPDEVQAVGFALESADSVDAAHAVLRYPAGVVGQLHLSWSSPERVRRLEVLGENGLIVLDEVRANQRLLLTPFNGHSGTVELQCSGSQPVQQELRHFFQCVRRRRSPLTDWRHGLEVIEVLDAIDRSIARRGAPVRVGKRERLRKD